MCFLLLSCSVATGYTGNGLPLNTHLRQCFENPSIYLRLDVPRQFVDLLFQLLRVEVEVSLFGCGAEGVEARVEHVHDVLRRVADDRGELLVPQDRHREGARVICARTTRGNASAKCVVVSERFSYRKVML